MRNRIRNDYFKWLVDKTCANRYDGYVTYNKLLARLHDIEFRYSIRKDSNRAADGVELRRRFALPHPEDEYDLILDALEKPCSVLEMMVALSLRCEEEIMDDPRFGDRTRQWFWGMVVSLGLGAMDDNRFDKKYVDETIDRFLKRKYEYDGRGGLFTIKDSNRDLREVEIWYQLCWYLDSIT